MIRLWFKLMLPLVGTLMSLWMIATWIYNLEPEFDQQFILPELRVFRPHVLTLAALGRSEFSMRRDDLQRMWEMGLQARDTPPPAVNIGPLEYGRIAARGGVFTWMIGRPDLPPLSVTIEVIRKDSFASITLLYVPLAEAGAWVRLEPVSQDEFDSQHRLSTAINTRHDRIVIGMLVVVGLLIALSFGFYVMFRLKSIRQVLQRIRAGDLSARVGVSGQDIIHQLAHDCDAMASRIQQLISQQDTMLRMLAHELRTPLARIDLGIHLAERENSGHPRLAAIKREIEHLDRLLQDLTKLIRIEHLVSLEAPTPVALWEVVDDLAADWVVRHPQICLILEVPAELSVIGYHTLIRVAIQNVINNAVRHARSKILIGASIKSGVISLWIDDDGPGVEESDREQIFQPFITRGEGSGIGLGLAIVQRILYAGNGMASCTQAPIGGARFLLEWPIKH